MVKKMQDVIMIVIVDDLVAIHRVGCQTEILIPGTVEEDHALHTVGGWMNIQTRTGGAGNDPCRAAETLDRANSSKCASALPCIKLFNVYDVGF
ncbi:hypothetical protein GBA52_016755 [Prunus armeniaca]|nr:hypothetical protein GBA52_016755 [Prunus armeniaca]